MVFYFAKVHFNLSDEATVICSGSFFRLPAQHIGNGVTMVFCFQSDALFNLEGDLVTSDTTLAIVDIDKSFGFFLRSVDIFFEMAPH